MLGQKVKDRLEHLQFSDHQRVILIDQLPVGYGGQLSGRILGLKIGLALDRKAVFADDADMPYIQSVVRPFSWTGDMHIAQAAPLAEISPLDPRALVRFNYVDFQKRLMQLGMRPKERVVLEWVDRLLADRFQLSRDDLQKLDGWLLSWLHFIPELKKKLSLDIERIGVSEKILGVHIRRGDKKVETAYVPSGRIADAIGRIYAVWKFEGVFVATDSADALSDLKLPPGMALLFDREESRYNNANHKMLFANPEMSSRETYVAFKNFRLLCQCGGIVGQDNAHFATLAASFIFNRDSKAERIDLIDPNRGPKITVFTQQLKVGLRSIVKSVFPRSILTRLDRMIYRRK